jgi:hypothetical protein
VTNSSPNSPYNQALGQTLIERSIRERIVLVGVTLNGKTEEETEASLDELSLLIDTAGADEAGRLTQKRDVPDHTWFEVKVRPKNFAICVWLLTPTLWFLIMNYLRDSSTT